MIDPIGNFLRARELYITYLDTAFAIRNSSVAEERRQLLRRPGTLCTEPLLEALPKYKSESRTYVHDLVDSGSQWLPGFSDAERAAFAELVMSGLFPSKSVGGDARKRRAKFPLYDHQLEMLLRGVQRGRPGVVTSGTGSGKTESFLLPILATIAREACGWDAPGDDYLKQRWWWRNAGVPYLKWTGDDADSFPRDRRPILTTVRAAKRALNTDRPVIETFRPHRRGEAITRPQAVRALILYPMNALVEDQLTRLRGALDSRIAHDVMDRHFHRNRIFFARYTSETPVTGWNVHPRFHPANEKEAQRRDRKSRDLFMAMRNFEKVQQAATNHDKKAARQLWEREHGKNKEEQFAAFWSSLERPEDTRFLFPSPDGSELCSRWDIQATPPDILITNVSMLNGMLMREIDEPIFDKTRAWLQSDPNAYFFLVLDELHLQRGAAGTETSHLLRVLLQRLGLDDAAHRHKLRILCSSASMPRDTIPLPSGRTGRDESIRYLFDMFADHGMSRDAGIDIAPDAEVKEGWWQAIIPGEPREPSPAVELPPLPFRAFLSACKPRTRSPFGANDPQHTDIMTLPDPRDGGAWVAVLDALAAQGANLELQVNKAIERAAELLAAACTVDGKSRAVALRAIAGRIFGSPDEVDAVRGLALVRGAGEAFTDWFGTAPPDTFSFRLHTFFKSVEGLYAPVVATPPENEPRIGRGERHIGTLAVERIPRGDVADGLAPRIFETLYCECCGELFVGGLVAKQPKKEPRNYELLPLEPDIDGLPEAAMSDRFEDLSYLQHRVFWPTTGPGASATETYPAVAAEDLERWVPAVLDPFTGELTKVCDGWKASDGPRRQKWASGEQLALPAGIPPEVVRGYVFERKEGSDAKNRNRGSRGTNVPFQCPACRESYAGRQKPLRMSPIRNFRAGFGKTTQLLATELFAGLKLESVDPKLVSFSDSRQDAARAALDIEKRHHQDVLRQLLVREVGRELDRRTIDASRLTELKAEYASLAQSLANLADDPTALVERVGTLNALKARIDKVARRDVALTDLLENPDGHDYQGSAPTRGRLRPFVAALVKLGIHPTDPAGEARIQGALTEKDTRSFDWADLIDVHATPPDWKNAGDSSLQGYVDAARRNLLTDVHRLLSEVIFSKTYFSLEQSGMAFVTAGLTQPKGDVSPAEVDAFLRLLGDAYRLLYSPYAGDPPTEWLDASQVLANRRIGSVLATVWPSEELRRKKVQAIIEALDPLHPGMRIHGANVRVQMVSHEDPVWRCGRCLRVHLHRGFGMCTRCAEALPIGPNARVDEVRRRNFLAYRLIRDDHDTFRLHCEELTGQTDVPLERQIKFKGIIVPQLKIQYEKNATGDWEPKRDPDTEQVVYREERAFREREEIDLLTVTTTMEVGVDIGQLQGVLQANMPPQRFNYQQRVGRAGRRGQAFSQVLTICRTKSHDVYYFDNPEKITGDDPPPPFLNKDMPFVAARLVRKGWLWAAFRTLRLESAPYPEVLEDDAEGVLPADRMRPPDIHGEFVSAGNYEKWSTAIVNLLQRPEVCSHRDRVADALARCTPLTKEGLIERVGTADVLGGEMSRAAQHGVGGLAEALASAGLLPMFGMPTRVRTLYTGPDAKRSLPNQVEWKTVDRDLDLAIYEFAPGRILVKDKQEHLAVALVGPLGPRLKGKGLVNAEPLGPAFVGPEYLVECTNCGTWESLLKKPDTKDLGSCPNCQAQYENQYECIEPRGFRTNFNPRTASDAEEAGPTHRALQSIGKPLLLRVPSEGDDIANLTCEFSGTARTYRINLGTEQEELGEEQETAAPPEASRSRAGTGFNLVPARKEFRFRKSPRQLTSTDGAGNPAHYIDEVQRKARRDNAEVDSDHANARLQGVFLVAPKTTDALQIAPAATPPGLSLANVVRTSRGYDSAQRAAAVSAAFVIANTAAFELDTDPDEFDVFEPRQGRTESDEPIPLLQLADHLVNGAGFCRRLQDDQFAILRHVVRRITEDPKAYPLDRMLDEHHIQRCDSACYQCLLRYGNRAYHGLLDWRLALSFVESLRWPHFDAGLTSGFETFASLRGWPRHARNAARVLERRFGASVESIPSTPLTRIRFPASSWAIVGHPLWAQDDNVGIVADARKLMGEHAPLVHTFDLVRRPLQVYLRLTGRERAS